MMVYYMENETKEGFFMQMTIEKTEQTLLKGLQFVELYDHEDGTYAIRMAVADYIELLKITAFENLELENNSLEYYQDGKIDCEMVLWVSNQDIAVDKIDFILYIPQFGEDGIINFPSVAKERIVQYLLNQEVIDVQGNILRIY